MLNSEVLCKKDTKHNRCKIFNPLNREAYLQDYHTVEICGSFMANDITQMGGNNGCKFIRAKGLPSWSDGSESACNMGDLGLIHGLEVPLEKRMVTHSNILAWRIP